MTKLTKYFTNCGDSSVLSDAAEVPNLGEVHTTSTHSNTSSFPQHSPVSRVALKDVSKETDEVESALF